MTTYSDYAKMIDHSLLSPTLAEAELEAGIDLALLYDVASVCIMPYYVPRLTQRLKGSTVQVSTTIGFPHGGHTKAIKLAEAEQALADGCQELDMVVNISKVLTGDWGYVEQEIAAITERTHQAGQKIKVIFENAYLQDAHKIRLCEICSLLNCDWVKTSTGYAPSGATLEDLALMRKHSAAHVQVKAAGGVRDFATLQKVRELGVSRCGASRTAPMLEEARVAFGLSPLSQPSAAPSKGY